MNVGSFPTARRPLKRDRSIRACTPCRTRKVKCDLGRPTCGQCQKYSSACEYPSRKRTAEQRASGEQSAQAQANASSSTTTLWAGSPGKAASDDSRYVSGVSWLPDTLEHISTNTPTDDVAISSESDQRFNTIGDASPVIVEALSLAQSDVQGLENLVEWYLENCHVYTPVSGTQHVKDLLSICVSSTNTISADDLLLIVAMAYTSSIYIEAWNPSAKLSAPSHTWQRLGDTLLSAQGYPHRTCLESIRPAILLAQQGVSEKPIHPDPSKITVLARATQMAGLQQDPALLKLPPDQCSDRRKLYWLVRELDLGFSVAHGLPCLLKSSDSSVEPLHHEETVAAIFLNFRIRATNVFEKILEKVYGPRRCLVSTVVDLQAEVQQLENEANTLVTKHRTESGAAGRFVAYAVEMIVARLCYTLNQPYLRDPSWGQRCRNLTLQGATNFLEKYQRRRKDFVCAPFTWVFEQFNVYHPCAILLQDLIKNVETIDIENDCRAQTVLQVFREFYDEKDSHWIKLEQLRLKAWYVNSWILSPHQNGSALEVDIDLVDWDNLFSSFIAEDMSMFQNTAIPDCS